VSRLLPVCAIRHFPRRHATLAVEMPRHLKLDIKKSIILETSDYTVVRLFVFRSTC